MRFFNGRGTDNGNVANFAVALVSILGMVAFLGFVSSADAQTSDAPTEGDAAADQDVQVFKDWYLRCGSAQTGEKRCILLQDLIDQESKRPLMQLAVGFWGPDNLRGIIITLPLGVTLPPGIEVQIDGQPIGRAPFFQCTVNGCQSRVPLEDELLAKLKAGQGGVVAFRDGQGRNVPLAFSLRGFTAGFGAVQ